MATEAKTTEAGSYLASQPVTLALLSALAIVGFLLVTGLSHVYHGQQDSLAVNSYARGVSDLQAGQFASAVSEFRTALRYAPENYSYQLNLAEALLGLKRIPEARAYLITLWERQPENGMVSLLLARIAAGDGQSDEALRYYHNAIYATWPSDQESRRRDTRLELIEYLLRANSKTQAQSELLALAANVRDQPDQQTHLGELFLEAQDYEHALAAFRDDLKSPRRSQADLAGAGMAAFKLGRYALAQRYLQEAVTANAKDAQSAATLKTTELVLQMDPFRAQISLAQRNRAVAQAFKVAGARLTACAAHASTSTQAGPLQPLVEKWTKLRPQITQYRLQRSADLVEEAMDLVFDIENETSGWCEGPTESDAALLLIAKLHEGS